MMGDYRLTDNNPDELPRELVEMGRRIAELPAEYQANLTSAYEQVLDSSRRRRRILNLVQEALSQLRLDIKYLMFDLEVTRNERDALQQERED